MKLASIAGVSMAISLLGGCAGARSRVTFEEARYPISMTAAVPGRDGRVLSKCDLESLGRFQAGWRGWNLGWTLVSLNSPDFSKEINEQVEKAGGEAVVNLRVVSALPIWPDVLPGYLFLHWLPVWPGSVSVDLEGDIVRSQRGAVELSGHRVSE